jgi:Polyketide cyclase / dehydrase and lipid transport
VTPVLRVEASITIRAPKQRVAAIYADYPNWPRLFPTIKGVRLIGRQGAKQVLEVDHVEGKVINELVVRPPDEIDLWEVKRHYDARFANRFQAVPGGTRCTVRGDIHLKGWAKLLQPFLRGHARRQIEKLQLRPVRAAAEAGPDVG